MNQVNFTTKGTDEILVIAFSKIILLKFNFRLILATRFSFNPKIIHRHTVDFHWILFPNQKVCVCIYMSIITNELSLNLKIAAHKL